jgi:hypothetical protein
VVRAVWERAGEGKKNREKKKKKRKKKVLS